ncbi:uncharacterized protein LOC134194771 isoform X1 [Corticium candelabrum]|uniref:uncharacterized protein LOC134194771 isoform X1 n=1 Tax=Corticium candelabrum TaxID=121492 RepID=UPI002E26E7C9|nr:uncharacterized protein LOC134194771 isoform X1 [Corticium candelabrum]XP_062519719.1 uncharacterized protein LOC134194771 isoform X1 [Corticium candelabrum]
MRELCGSWGCDCEAWVISVDMSSAHGSSRMRGHSSHNLGRHLAPEKPHELIPDYYASSTGISNWNGLQLSGSACNKSTSFLESGLSLNMSYGTVPGGRRSLSHSNSGSQGWTSGTGSELSYDDVTIERCTEKSNFAEVVARQKN